MTRGAAGEPSPPEEGFAGSWRLVSHYYADEDGSTSEGPCGPDADGLLIYEVCGYMSAALMRTRHAADGGVTANRPPVAYMGYSGRWRVAGDVVIHKVLLSSHPRILHTEQVREFHFDGDRLTLSERIGGSSRALVLKWRRASAGGPRIE